MLKPDDIFDLIYKYRENSNYRGGTPVGAALVKENDILILGCNEYPPGVDADFLNSLSRKERTQFCLHAEQNVLLKAAAENINTRGAHMYITRFPCITCISAMIKAGIEEIHFLDTISVEERWESRRLFTFKNTGIKFYEHKRDENGQLYARPIL